MREKNDDDERIFDTVGERESVKKVVKRRERERVGREEN